MTSAGPDSLTGPVHAGSTGLSRVVAITWIDHRRTREICTFLGIELHVLTTPFRGLRRYLQLIPVTTLLLRRLRPRVVLIQSPSIVLALLMILLRRLLRVKVVLDAHNEAVEPFINPSALVRWLTHWMLGRASGVVVTNRFLAEVVSIHHGRPVVVPDRIPDPPFPAVRAPAEPSSFKVTIVATFAADEPMQEILAAAAQVAPGFEFSITGDATRLSSSVRREAPPNVTFTGFLAEDDFWSLLRCSDLVMDLTLIDNCLVCGAYEALAVGTPLLLSNNAASVDLFGAAACFTRNDCASIVSSLHDARERVDALRQGVIATRRRLNGSWPTDVAKLRSLLVELANGD